MENKLEIQFGVVPGWGICTPFLSPIAGHLQLFQNKMTKLILDKCLGGGGGGSDTLGND